MQAREILCKEGIRYDSKNILELGKKTGIKLYIAA
jgi:hypothetical protein